MVDEPIRCPLGEDVAVSFYRSALSRAHRVMLEVSEANELIIAHMTVDQARELARRLTVAADAIDPPANVGEGA